MSRGARPAIAALPEAYGYGLALVYSVTVTVVAALDPVAGTGGQAGGGGMPG